MKSLKVFSVAILLIGIVLTFVMEDLFIYAGDTSETIQGKLYTFEEDNSDYAISASGSVKSDTNNTIGTFSINGDITRSNSAGGRLSYNLNNGDATFKYSFNSAVLSRPKTDWCIEKDNKKRVDEIDLDHAIDKGIIIVQYSYNGINWVTDLARRNAFADAQNYNPELYLTNKMQSSNGCYYRVIVAYKMKMETNPGKWGNKTNHRRNAEVYEFYIENGEDKKSANGNTKEYYFTQDVIKTDGKKGYDTNEKPNDKDPHFTWKLGYFYMSGYTEDKAKDGKPVFLKNVGDEITLRFHLDQKDINSLNSNKNLKINYVKKGTDTKYGKKDIEFKRGALFIRYTDRNNKSYAPVVYTDYLAAVSTTTADTCVKLFEEGDYEVKLDYEIYNGAALNKYTQYKIEFEFSVRNGDCNVYPMDLKTGSELRDNAITPNGFRLDLARSKYLSLEMQLYGIKRNEYGIELEPKGTQTVSESGEYQKEGVYIITVTNEFLNAPVEKRLYVGDDKYLQALHNGRSIEEINEKMSKGYTLNSSGILISPTPTPTPTPIPSPTDVPALEPTIVYIEVTPIEKPIEDVVDSDEMIATPPSILSANTIDQELYEDDTEEDIIEKSVKGKDDENTADVEEGNNGGAIIAVVAVIIIGGIAVVIVLNAKRNRRNIDQGGGY